MSQNYSPSLINNGLVFCVDAADNKSAPHNQLPVKLGCVTWLDGADDDVFTFSSGTSVYEWRDKSGYNNNVYQSTTDNQPSRSTTYNSKSVVVFDGSNDSLSSTNSLDLSQGSTMFVMVRGYTSTSDAGVISINNVLSHGITIHNGNTTYFYYGSGGYHTTQSTGGTSETNLFVKVWTGETSGNRISYKNGTKGFSTGTMASSNSTGVLRLGQQSTYLNGLIGEVIIYNRELTQAEITKVNNYLQNKWNITVSDATWYNRAASTNGSIENGPTYSATNNGYFQFDGTDQFIDMPYAPIWQNISNITYDMWFKADVVNSRQGLISSHKSVSGSNNDAVEIEIESDGTSFVGFRSTNGTFYAAHYNSSISAGVWYNLTAVLDSTGFVRYYLNGEQVGQNSSWPGGNVANSASETLLLARYATHYFDGSIANFKAYDRVLTYEEIQQNYKNFKTRFGH